MSGLLNEIRASKASDAAVVAMLPKGKGKAKEAKVGASKVEPKGKAKADAKAEKVEKVEAPKVETVEPAKVEPKADAAADAAVTEVVTEVVTAPDAEPVVVKGKYALEDNIPLPNNRGGGGGSEAKYPWAEMNVDQSFFIPGGKIRTVYASASKAAKRTGRKFSSRPVEGGVRVWRTA